MSPIQAVKLTCEYQSNPIGIGTPHPRFGWQMRTEERDAKQSAYRILVAENESSFALPVWDSGKVESDDSIQVVYGGAPLKPRARYFYKVKIWDGACRASEWSETGYFETALFSTDEWKAKWITPKEDELDKHAEPAFLLRKRFVLKDKPVSARVYSTAAGIYELEINGRQVTEDLFAPGWTSYHSRIQYQTYDVTSLLRTEGNCIGILLGDGWYRSGMGNAQRNFRYGDRRAALLQLHIRYADGTEEIVATDESWKAATGAIRYSTILHGETYDARLEQEDWSTFSYDDSLWLATEACELPMNVLVAQENESARVTETLKPIAAWVTPAGERVLDMGQNMVGRIRMTLDVPEGTEIVLSHAEVLDGEGNFYVDNLRSAKQTVRYIAKGRPGESYAPHFTFMGFRYVKVEGFPLGAEGLPLEAFVGEVIHTDMEPTGSFECSDERVNQLQRNIRWGQRGNFLDLPTDCPQRDERLGWTGDAQVFISTALFNYHGASFFAKWLHDLREEQMPDGGVPMVVPDVERSGVSAGWGDAAVICPWTVYQYYGDKRLLAEQYASMRKWVEYIRAQGDQEYLWNSGFHCGDWLALDAMPGSYVGATPLPFIATAYYAYSARILRDAAKVLDRKEDYIRYEALHRNVVHAFRREFVTEAGIVAYPTQTAYVLALAFDLLEEPMRPRVAKDLHELIVDNGYHLTTGFIGTPYLCTALSNHGYHATAVRLLLQDSYPGWLYSVSQGATTIWEHWDGIKPDGTFWSENMNSFNHYAYGAIGDWLYRKVAGLGMDETVPAYKRVRIEPLFGLESMSYARATFQSPYGEIESAWSLLDNNEMKVEVRIPPNATAEVVLRGAFLEEAREGGKRLHEGNGIHSIKATEKGIVLSIGSGRYEFSYPIGRTLKIPYSYDTRLDDALSTEAATAILKRELPQIFHIVDIIRTASFKQIVEFPLTQVSRERMDSVLEQLNSL
ncbi:alpha-L-rhamnosidase [Cohnella thailandensis]|uniref:alpha-L-rhamnosidase n=1 Tax=Cohnella thailandensis TaxID=557557 RepID=A0A841SZA8_9BACL|nr:alpha-L-rhamnosidase [Cohnella thailandensis]MBB6636612.1 family 78 glycoside hydrolase catalytic domain [Cohnella thailandensis]MBP1973514.1 alpha-L-rhamnosidase [Cohnella thailandensis]